MRRLSYLIWASGESSRRYSLILTSIVISLSNIMSLSGEAVGAIRTQGLLHCVLFARDTARQPEWNVLLRYPTPWVSHRRIMILVSV